MLSDWLLAEVKWCVRAHLRRSVAGGAGVGLAFAIRHMKRFQHLTWQINTGALSGARELKC